MFHWEVNQKNLKENSMPLDQKKEKTSKIRLEPTPEPTPEPVAEGDLEPALITEPEPVVEGAPELEPLPESVREIVLEPIPEPEPSPEPPLVLNGFSGSADSLQDIDNIINALNTYGGNCYRIAFNPEWTTGTRPWTATQQYGPSGIDKINYFLENSDHYIIVDRNHFTDNTRLPYNDQNSNQDWVQIEQTIFNDVLSNWGNNPRVIIEIINEYPNRDMYVYAENIVSRIREAGYTNRIMVNKHTQVDDWQRQADESPGLSYYGHHAYFNNLDDPGTQYHTVWKQKEHMERALATDSYPIVNTEIGASFKEASQFTVGNVAVTNEYLWWSNERQIGNLVWMNHGLRNLGRYEELGFNPEWRQGTRVETV